MNHDELHDSSSSRPDPRDLALLAFLRRHPEMRQRIFEMTQRLESEGGNLDAHEIEDLVVEEVRALGHATLSDWAVAAEEHAYQESKARGGVHLHEKKLHWQSTLGQIEIMERTLRSNAGGELVRPFCEANAIGCRGYSRRLQRAMTDFGIEHSFAQAAARIREHYGIEVSVAAVRQATQEHARAATRFMAASDADAETVEAAITASQVICEMDGSMLPVVEVEKPTPQADGRKHRRCSWKEVRLCAAVARGSVTPTYAVSFEGTAHAGMALASAARAAGLGEHTTVHGVGDGAPWIAAEVDNQFGSRATYLIDFYHVSEYLAAAAALVCPDNPQLWRHNQQEALKAGRLDALLNELTAFLAAQSEAQPQDHPVVACLRYLENRRDHLDYRAAIDAQLPIGSGLIESGHRHLLQSRLKRAGAWWLWDNAKAMAHLRVLRQNRRWEAYWAHRSAA